MRRITFTLITSLVPAVLAFPTGPVAAQAEGPDDATIVAIFDAANTADMETGALAAEKAQTASVREFGRMLARDHQAVRQQGRDLAAKLKVTPTPPADRSAAAAHAKALATLRAKSGLEFDRAFLEHEVAYHAAVSDAIKQALLPATDNPELRALVVQVAPAFEAHRQAAQQLLDKLPSTSR